jgi:hypothetical protein
MPRIGTGLGLGLFRAAAGGGFDPDAQAFFDRVTTAGGTLTTTEKNATNQLVLDMKSAGIWSSMKAIYPMVGASAAACAQNLKSSSFTGTFTSGWTFASTGVTPNGSSAFFNTTLTPSVSLSLNSAHISSYIRTTNSGSQMYVGGYGSAGSSINITYLLNFGFLSINSTDTGVTSVVGQNGLFLNTRTSSTNTVQYKNATALSTIATVSTGSPNAPLYVGAYNQNNGTPTLYSNNQTAFVSIGDGLNGTQESNFYTAVQAFQTTLARQV